MTKKSRQQLNIELADAHVFDRLSQVSDNLGISKRDIVEELIMDFLEREPNMIAEEM